MLKKLTLLGMSVAALIAFAAPAAQAANPLIVDSITKAPVTKLTALSTNTITHTSAGTLECTTVHLKGHITVNTNNTATGSGTGHATGTPKGATEAEKHTGHCASSGGPLVEVTSVTLSHIHLEKHATATTGTANFSFTYDLRSAPTPGGLIAECTFGTTETHKVAVTKTGADTIQIHGNIVRTAGGAFCPATGTITGDFTATNEETGAPVIIN
jgi:hypothetical protein